MMPAAARRAFKTEETVTIYHLFLLADYIGFICSVDIFSKLRTAEKGTFDALSKFNIV